MVHLPGKGVGKRRVPGKGVGKRRVPLLLTPDVVTAMDALVNHRAKSCIPDTNLYFFATPSENGFINGWQAMRNVSEAAKLDRPDLVHSTRLRKYIATVSQVRAMKVCSHLFVLLVPDRSDNDCNCNHNLITRHM